jgi:site-specific DNA-methyltransferase (adenine-specific)
MIELRIETVNVNSLTPDPANARKHDGKNLQAIAHSLEKFGQRKPICVTPDSIVVAGNGTLEAAKSLGWTEIVIARTPVGWSWEQIRAFALADNRTAELAEWDDKVLADQLLELDANGWELEELGFENLEPPAGQDDDEEPLSFDDAPTRAKLGDHWVVGKHHVICGDSTDLTLIARFKTSFDAVVTDPPYGIGAGSWTRLGKGRINNNVSEWDNSKPPIAWILDLAPVAIIWGGNYFTDELPVTNDWLCWHKKNDDRTFSEFELAWTNLGKQCRHLSHHWSGEQKQHMTMKPSPVMDWCVSFIDKGAKILDVFSGSGSTLLAADRNGQQAFGVELDPKYVDVILDRLEKQTGLEAQLLED